MANNGMITKIWGSSGWLFNHTVTFGYPLEPTERQKQAYMQYFFLLGEVLPCGYCRDSYQGFIQEDDTKLDLSVMENRETLTRWFYKIHEKVNAKLGLRYLITYADMVRHYESFRAKCSGQIPALGCTDPLSKGYSFRQASKKDAPFIPVEMAKSFARMAEMRRVDMEECGAWLRLIDSLEGDHWEVVHTEVWEQRNYLCVRLIRYMREMGIESIEKSGPWEGFPTYWELVLILHQSSQIPLEELTRMAREY